MTKNTKILLSLFILIFIGSFPINKADATTYYVDATGGSDAYDGLAGTYDGSHGPWQTLSKVQTMSASFQPGDSCLFKRGETFTGVLNIAGSGSVSGDLTFSDYGSGNLPIINSNSTYALRLFNKSYVTIQNLHVQNGSAQNILFTSGGNHITLNDLTSSNGVALQTNTGSTYSNITINGFTIDASSGTYGMNLAGTLTDFTLTNITESGGVDGLYALLTAGSNVTISNSTFNSNSLRGVRIRNIDGLTVSNIQTNSNGTIGFLYEGTGSNLNFDYATSTGNTGGGLTFNTSTSDASDITINHSFFSADNDGNGVSFIGTGTVGNVTVSNSISSNNLGGDGFNVQGSWSNVVFDKCIADTNGTDGSGADGDGFTFHDNATGTVQYSVAKNNKKSAIANIDASSMNMYYNLFYHETNGTIPLVNLRNTGTHVMYNNIIHSDAQSGTGIGLEDTVNVTFKNNIVNGFDIGLLNSSGGTITNDYNIVYGAGTNNYSGITAGSHSIEQNPAFTNSTTRDFTLLSTSPAINTGVNLGASFDDAVNPGSIWTSEITTDDQDLRGSNWEIGPYIYPVPQAPTVGTPTAQSSSSIRWNFTDNADDETGFRVYDNTNTQMVTSANANLTYLDETGLSENTSYSGRYISSYNSYGNSASSSEASAIYTLADTPTNLSASAEVASITLGVDSLPNDSSGQSGYYFSSSSGQNSGWIQTNSWEDTGLGCGSSYNYSVKYRNGDGVETDSISTSKTTASCGGGLPPIAYELPKTPEEGFKITINSGDNQTPDRHVILNFNAGKDVEKVAISMTGDFSDSSQVLYKSPMEWDLCSKFAGLIKSETCPSGQYTVYAKFVTPYGRTSNVVSDTITLNAGQNNSIQSNINYSPKFGEDKFTKSLKYDQTDADIKRLQIFLNSDPDTKLTDTGVGSAGRETDYFGPLTYKAVIKFQEKYADEILSPWNLRQGTGYVGKTTLQKINELIGISLD